MMMKKIKEKITEQVERAKWQIPFALNYGTATGIKNGIKFFEKYRIFMGYVFLAATIILMFLGKFSWAVLTFAMFHFHSYLNQMWWKFKTMEDFMDSLQTTQIEEYDKETKVEYQTY